MPIWLLIGPLVDLRSQFGQQPRWVSFICNDLQRYYTFTFIKPLLVLLRTKKDLFICIIKYPSNLTPLNNDLIWILMKKVFFLSYHPTEHRNVSCIVV